MADLVLKIILYFFGFIFSIGVFISVFFIMLRYIRAPFGTITRPKITKNERYKIDTYSQYLKDKNL